MRAYYRSHTSLSSRRAGQRRLEAAHRRRYKASFCAKIIPDMTFTPRCVRRRLPVCLYSIIQRSRNGRPGNEIMPSHRFHNGFLCVLWLLFCARSGSFRISFKYFFVFDVRHFRPSVKDAFYNSSFFWVSDRVRPTESRFVALYTKLTKLSLSFLKHWMFVFFVPILSL